MMVNKWIISMLIMICKYEDDFYDDDSREYIKSTVAVDFLPYIAMLV